MRWEEHPNKKGKTNYQSDYRQYNNKLKTLGNQQYLQDEQQMIYLPRSKLKKMESQIKQLKQQIIRQKHAMRKQIIELKDKLDSINSQNKLARKQQLYLRHMKKSMSQRKIGKLEGFSQKIPINRQFQPKYQGMKGKNSQQNKEFKTQQFDDYMFSRNRPLLQFRKDNFVNYASLDTKMRSRKQFWH